MENDDLIKEAFEISDKYGAILKGSIKIKGDINCLLFAFYCRSVPFYRHFFYVTRNTLQVNSLSNKNLKEIKNLIKQQGYKKIWTKGVFSFYGDLRPLAVEAGFGRWSENGLVENERYGTDFLITAIFYK